MSPKRYELTPSTLAFLGLLFLFFGVFLFYPISLLLHGAFVVKGKLSLTYFHLLLSSPFQRQSLLNSFLIAFFTTGLTTLLTVPLAYLMTRFGFPGKALLSGLLLVPMIMPPFVGAIGLKQLLARFVSVNLMLVRLAIIPPEQPVDWLRGGRFLRIISLQCLDR